MANHLYFEKFKILEKKLRKIAKASDADDFYHVLNKVEEVNYLIKYKRGLLRDLNALRNVFAHSDREKYIAEVNQLAFEEIDKLIKLLNKPPTVNQLFNKKVYSVNLEEILELVIKEMQKNIYTHVPVYKDGKFWGIFSETSILSWLVENINEGKADFYKPQMKNVKREYLYNQTNIVDFISEKTSIFKVPELFSKAINKSSRLGALLITKTGDKDELPTGIITAWDLPLIDDYINRFIK